jgi:hypothetical protein
MERRSKPDGDLIAPLLGAEGNGNGKNWNSNVLPDKINLFADASKYSKQVTMHAGESLDFEDVSLSLYPFYVVCWYFFVYSSFAHETSPSIIRSFAHTHTYTHHSLSLSLSRCRHVLCLLTSQLFFSCAMHTDP